MFITAAMERLYQIFCHDRGPIKANFVELGGLQLVLEMSEDPETLLQDHATKVAALFPQELVNRYSPAYNRAILEKLASGYEDQPTKISSTIEAELSSTPAPQENQAEGGAALDAGFTNNELQIESIENDETKCECQDTSNIEESFEASNGDDRRSVEQSLTNSGCE